MLPKKLETESHIHVVHTSSPIGKGDMKFFTAEMKRLVSRYPNTKEFEVERAELDPRYLSASEDERLHAFRDAIQGADWILPSYGGTGCADIIRRLNERDLAVVNERRPIVNGFSDTTFLVNYLYFKTGLVTFHYANAAGLYGEESTPLFFNLLRGVKTKFSYREPAYEWLGAAPKTAIEGLAIGGNLTVFRDLLDICEIDPPSWQPYILFIEDIDLDAEDFHRIIIALDQRGIFRHIRAIVMGRMDEPDYAAFEKRLSRIFGKPKDQFKHLIQYLLNDAVRERAAAGDPLFILHADNLGHNVLRNAMIVPIGGKTMLRPDCRIEFNGPFVQ